jgi:G3E family GTPase
VALHLLLTEAKPTRLLVETTGLGHPARLLDRLRTQYADRLDVRATIGLVAPDDVTNEHVLANPIFREQVDLAEVLVLNKLDRARPGDVEAFHTWADELFPPKLLIAATEQGKLDPAWLDVGAPPSAGLPMALEAAAPLAPPTERVSPGARGWIFPASDTFDEAKLLAFLSGLASTRLKGVFRVADGSIVVNRAGAQTTVRPTHYRLDSRVEIFGDLDWARVETGLTDCRIER